MLAEQQTEWIINNNLVNKGWCIDNNNKLKNVYFQKSPYPEDQKKLEVVEKKGKYKKPDYILYETGTRKPIGIIEAKASGINLQLALKQATDYAECLSAPLIFAMNGSYCETRFVPNGKELVLNGNEVRELIKEVEALKFLTENTNEIYTIPKEIIVSREDLIKTFKNLNDTLRSEGLRAGIERFSEFANILFLKLISENNRKSWWNSIKAQSNDDIIGYINGHVIGEIQYTYGGNVFTHLNIENPQTLRHIIDCLDPLTLSTIDTDIKGDAFEYFLEKTTSTENDLGEYFTPRTVVKTIINLVDPKFKETIYDPFCGTGGFLTAAFHYIRENTLIEKEELKRLQNNTFFGREITTTARIAKMNMILHGDGHSGIDKEDSLLNPIDGKYDVIVTNMPFSQTITRKAIIDGKIKIENHISPFYYNGIAKNSGDAVCVLHCLRALKEVGRMALVVPEGFLFRKDLGNVRKFLLSKTKLQSVISLPQGTFLPYTGVKTDILYFTDAHKPNNQKSYWYFEAKNIGVSLDNHKRKIKGDNDLKKIESSDIRKVDKKPDLKQNLFEIGFEIIDLEKVKNNGWNLVGNVYKENVERSDYKTVKLLEVCSFINGYAFKSNNFSKEESINTLQVVRIGDINKDSGLVNIEEGVYHKKDSFDKFIIQSGDILIAMTGATVGKVGLYNTLNTEALLNQRVGLLKVNSSTLKSYIYYILRYQKFYTYCQSSATGIAQGNISGQQILDFLIPLPSLEEQQVIVNELDSYQKIIQGAKQVVENWKPCFEIDNNWELVKLNDIIKFIRGFSYKSEILSETGIPMYNLKSVKKDFSSEYDFKFIKLNTKIQEKYFCYKGDLLIAITDLTPTSKIIGRSSFVQEEGVFSMDLAKLKSDSSKVYNKYLYYIFNNENFLTKARKFSVGNNVKHLNLDNVLSIQIPLPSLEIQQEIVNQLETEQKMIESQREIIKLFEEKIIGKLNSLWQQQ